MASADLVGLRDGWAELRENPVFRRTLIPRGVRALVRSPVVRTLALTALALYLFDLARLHLGWSIIWSLASVILFWFLISAVQRWFCWMELRALAETGTLHDYINSGLTRADVAMGIIYPARIAETLSILLILVTSLFEGGDGVMMAILIFCIFNRVMSLREPPFVFLPDAETYLRHRNPLSLVVISVAVAVPLIAWFVVLFGAIFGLSFLLPALGMKPGPNTVFVAAFLITMVVSGLFDRFWHRWRLRRFYRRFENFDEMFDRFVEEPG